VRASPPSSANSVGGAIFACEVIHRYGLEYYEAFIPTVIAGTACNFAFRFLLDLPQEAIWTFPPESGLSTIGTLYGVMLGVVGGYLGRLWIQGTIWLRVNVLMKYKLGARHILKGTIGGFLIGLIGAVFPETLFWAQNEAQPLIDGGATPLPNVWPAEGIFGASDLTSPLVLILIGGAKLVAISITVLAGYRGGFIFPFMFAGISFGTAFNMILPSLGAAAAALSLAAAINTSVTRTVLATPVVLITLSGRPDVLPCVLVASVVSLYMTGDVSIIKAARTRYLSSEILGADDLTDNTPADAKPIGKVAQVFKETTAPPAEPKTVEATPPTVVVLGAPRTAAAAPVAVLNVTIGAAEKTVGAGAAQLGNASDAAAKPAGPESEAVKSQQGWLNSQLDGHGSGTGAAPPLRSVPSAKRVSVPAVFQVNAAPMV